MGCLFSWGSGLADPLLSGSGLRCLLSGVWLPQGEQSGLRKPVCPSVSPWHCLAGILTELCGYPSGGICVWRSPHPQLRSWHQSPTRWLTDSAHPCQPGS